MDFPWDRVAVNAGQPGMRLAPTPPDTAIASKHPALADQHATMFSAACNPGEAEKLFKGTAFHVVCDIHRRGERTWR